MANTASVVHCKPHKRAHVHICVMVVVPIITDGAGVSAAAGVTHQPAQGRRSNGILTVKRTLRGECDSFRVGKHCNWIVATCVHHKVCMCTRTRAETHLLLYLRCPW